MESRDYGGACLLVACKRERSTAATSAHRFVLRGICGTSHSHLHSHLVLLSFNSIHVAVFHFFVLKTIILVRGTFTFRIQPLVVDLNDILSIKNHKNSSRDRFSVFTLCAIVCGLHATSRVDSKANPLVSIVIQFRCDG